MKMSSFLAIFQGFYVIFLNIFISHLDPLWPLVIACTPPLNINFGVRLTHAKHFTHNQARASPDAVPLVTRII